MYINLFLAHKINHWYIIKNDPSAGSPTETLLRLLLSPINLVCTSFQISIKRVATQLDPIQGACSIDQSIVATGGVYKGQGLNQPELMTRTY